MKNTPESFIVQTQKIRDLPQCSYSLVRQKLLNREEIALLDVREEAAHAEGHPLFAANFPLSRIEMDAYTKLPRRDVQVATIDNGEGLAEEAALLLSQLGYASVSVFSGGISGWREAGGELFIDVNVPSKAFGELMESVCHTPSLSAQAVQELISTGADIFIADVRRFDEYQTMSIPTGTSVPGAELLLRLPGLLSSSRTKVIINCAGRTRGLLGTQSLINAGLENSVVALRNGTIGWTLANQALDIGQHRKAPEEIPSGPELREAQIRARYVADRASVKRVNSLDEIARLSAHGNRTTYLFDVRSEAEYVKGHIPGFLSCPGGQLVQETEMYAPVRGARIILVDSDNVRANMCASWLAQMDWDVAVLDNWVQQDFSAAGGQVLDRPPIPECRSVTPKVLNEWIHMGDVAVLDVSKYADYSAGHIPGAWYVLRSQFATALRNVPSVSRYVLTSKDSLLARYAAPSLARYVLGEVYVLTGGTNAWMRNGYTLEDHVENLASPALDRYRRPYEGTNISRDAMQAYLDWEFGLIEQLRRDGTHHFRPLVIERPESHELCA